MKTNNSLVNDGSVIDPSTDARYYQAYTLYFQKYAQAYAQNNIPIDFVVPQSHWQHHWGDPICPQHRRWQAWQNLSETITLPSGTHAVYLYLPAGSNNLDCFQLKLNGDTGRVSGGVGPPLTTRASCGAIGPLSHRGVAGPAAAYREEEARNGLPLLKTACHAQRPSTCQPADSTSQV